MEYKARRKLNHNGRKYEINQIVPVVESESETLIKYGFIKEFKQKTIKTQSKAKQKEIKS
jgi:hypothetical protein